MKTKPPRVVIEKKEATAMEFMLPFRQRINELDDEIVALLAQRFDVIRQVAAAKHQEGVAAVLPERVEEVKERNALNGESKGIDPDFMRKLYTVIIKESCDLEEVLMKAMEEKK